MSTNDTAAMEARRKRKEIEQEFQKRTPPGTFVMGWNVTLMLDEIVALRAERDAARAAAKAKPFEAEAIVPALCAEVERLQAQLDAKLHWLDEALENQKRLERERDALRERVAELEAWASAWREI